MGNIPLEAPQRFARRIGSLALKSVTAPWRGASIALGLLLAAAAWAAWTMPYATAQEAVRLDIGYAAENLVPPEALVGEWQAVIRRRGKPQPVFLRITEVSPGKTAGKMTFASPLRCVIDLEYGGPDRGRHIFYMIRFTNCFDYGRDDFVALSQVPGEDITGLIEASTRRKSDKLAEVLSKFNFETLETDAAAVAAPTPGARPAGLGRIVYAINLDGEVRDSAILMRQ